MFVNEDATRSFVGLAVRNGVEGVLKLIAAVDSVALAFQQPTYYEVHVARAGVGGGGG